MWQAYFSLAQCTHTSTMNHILHVFFGFKGLVLHVFVLLYHLFFSKKELDQHLGCFLHWDEYYYFSVGVVPFKILVTLGLLEAFFLELEWLILSERERSFCSLHWPLQPLCKWDLSGVLGPLASDSWVTMTVFEHSFLELFASCNAV